MDREIPFETEYIYDENLEAGKEVVESEGKVGKDKVTITTKITDGTGEVSEETTTITEKEDRKVRIGTKPVTKVVERPFNTEYQYDENLEAGKTEEVTPGKNGKVTITTTYDKDQKKVVTSETEEAGQNRVVKIGGKTNGTEKVKEEIPFEVEVRKDPSLKKGEWEYATDDEGNELKGEKGEQEKTLTIVNSKVTETSDPTVVKQSKNAVILVGDEDFTGEVKHKEHFEIPFEVEVRYNDKLPAGTSKEIQKGVKGSYDVEYTQKIKNGSADGEMTKEESNKVEAKKHIIEVGTKVETPENNYSKEVEVEVEYVYDDTKDKGVVETSEFTPGKVETKVVEKYNPETGKVEQTTEEVVTKAKQKVIVGTKDFTGKYEYDKTCPISPKVIVRENPEMEAGTSKVVQEGEDGSKTTHVTVDIKNGKVVENSEKETPGETKEAVDHIIEVGTKKTPNTCPAPENPKTPEDPEPNNPKEEEPNNPENPGKEDPEKPGKDKPNKPSESGNKTPNKPGEKTPSEPGDKTPNKIVENPSEDPKNSPQESPEKPKTEDVKDIEKNSTPEETREVEKKENLEDDNLVKNKGIERQVTSDDKAPKTGDAGLAMETASAGLASGLLLLLKRFKRRKEDEE